MCPHQVDDRQEERPGLPGEVGLLQLPPFDWPSSPSWLFRLAQGVHVGLGIALVPVVLAKLWSVIPKLFAWPPVRSPAQALERATLLLLVLVISVFGWPYLARIVRGQTMSIKQREYVESAKASGASSLQIIFREILPNLRSTIIVMTTLAIPGYVGTEAGLSFLGVGVVPPTPCARPPPSTPWTGRRARSSPWSSARGRPPTRLHARPWTRRGGRSWRREHGGPSS